MLAPRRGPVMLLVMDGWGVREEKIHNAIQIAKTPNINQLSKNFPNSVIMTSGTDVGLPKGTMGNSEVGHLNLGAGRIVWQDVMEIAQAIADGSFYENPALLGAIEHVKKNNSRLHLFGLVSSAMVHSLDEAYFALIRLCAKHKLCRDHVAIHVFTDGRDTAPKSGEQWVTELQRKLDLYDTGVIATLTGRYYGMDRDNRWDRVEKAWKALVDGVGEFTAKSGLEALASGYLRGETDEFIKATVIVDDAGKPRGVIQDGDAVISFNHRGDRPREMCGALYIKEFPYKDDRGNTQGFARQKHPQIHLVTIADYRDKNIRTPVAFAGKNVEGTIGEIVSKAGLKQLRIAETEKYPHVTFFFSGGREQPFSGEYRILVPSPKGAAVPTYDKKPEMSAPEVTEKVVAAIRSKKYDFIALNFANGDMVGHTGVESAICAAIETVDKCVGEIVTALAEVNGELLLTSDHGNAEETWDRTNNCPHTAHTLNPVPLYLISERFKNAKLRAGRLSDIAPTLAFMLGIERSPQMEAENLISTF
ncbi:MAG: 2,3-bisphosphoglycerate-independent phosphoglycerate mutase [Planctomycetota bacterium]